MIAPLALVDLVAADPLAPLKDAIRARLAALLPGVTVVSHPGKIDISEVVERTRRRQEVLSDDPDDTPPQPPRGR